MIDIVRGDVTGASGACRIWELSPALLGLSPRVVACEMKVSVYFFITRSTLQYVFGTNSLRSRLRIAETLVARGFFFLSMAEFAFFFLAVFPGIFLLGTPSPRMG